jgi:hypothetical protein
MLFVVAFGPYPKAAAFDANQSQRFFGVYIVVKKLKHQDRVNG